MFEWWNVETLSTLRSVAEVVFPRCPGRVRIQRYTPLCHFEEAVEDDEEFLEIGRNSSTKDIFLTLATDFLTEVLAREHLIRN
jgi:hypothetical protein